MSLDGLNSICIVSDGTDSLTQSRELALRLTTPDHITKIYKDEGFDNISPLISVSSRAEPRDLTYKLDSSTSFPRKRVHSTQNDKFVLPRLAIGVGFNVTETLVKLKQQSGGKTKIAIILDPLSHYEQFDFIILPSYEPYKITGSNVIRTTGLINFVNTKYLNLQKMEYDTHEKYKFLRVKKLKPPFLTVTIGGRHTGGNISAEDTKILAKKINELVLASGGTALITTSHRTEPVVSEVLEDNLDIPYFLYDYKKRESENPYGVFLALASEIIVTGESVRMMSEACSSGKAVRIYRPLEYGFQYKPLIDELIKDSYALEFNSPPPVHLTKLDEAGRVAQIIKDVCGF
jgi:mitochondrial fission protein ELM1